MIRVRFCRVVSSVTSICLVLVLTGCATGRSNPQPAQAPVEQPHVLAVSQPATTEKPSRRTAAQVLAIAGSTEPNDPSFHAADMIGIARAAGVEYETTLSAALNRSPTGLHALFGLTLLSTFDDSCSDEHATVLAALLRHLGDDFFSQRLDEETPAVRGAVRTHLLYEFGFFEDEDADLGDINEIWPLTFPSTWKPSQEEMQKFMLPDDENTDPTRSRA